MSPRGRVAYLGPEGTFTADAAGRHAPDATLSPLATIPDVIDAVRAGDADAGVVPIESSLEGAVNLTLDEFAFGEQGVYINAEITLPIVMNLLGRPGSRLDQIRVVRSHPHALAQARLWLAAHLPQVPQEPTNSTAEAVRQAANADGTTAAIGTLEATRHYQVEVLAADIQDHSHNMTRFVAIGRSLPPSTGADKTSLVLFFGQDRPGLLAQILNEFALRGINLTKIESRPTKKQLGEYCIFIDCAGHLTEPRVSEALRSVHRHVAELRILGTYARADGQQDVDVPGASDTAAAYAEADDWYARLLADISHDLGPGSD